MPWLAIAGFILTAVVLAASIGAAVLSLARDKYTKDTIATLADGNEGLREQVKDLQFLRVADNEKCAAEINALKGQLRVFEGGLVERIVSAVTVALDRTTT